MTAGKTKSHPALSPSRPSAASAAALVRDAVARLPRGEGARQEVEDLVRQSQFLSPAEVARPGVLANFVSGALDRLQAEQPEPCVKFDSGRRVWVYLHRGRSEGQLARLFEEQQHAPKKPRVARKPREVFNSPLSHLNFQCFSVAICRNC